MKTKFVPSLNLASFSRYKMNAGKILDAKLVEYGLDELEEEGEKMFLIILKTMPLQNRLVVPPLPNRPKKRLIG